MLLNRYYSGVKKRKQASDKPLKIMFATDSHVKAPVDGNSEAIGAIGGTRFFYTAGQKLQKFVDDVNDKKPDLVFCGGDMIEELNEGSEELFMTKWNQINSSIRKELTVGNHDLAWSPELTNTYIADAFGYGDRPIIAGSKFNQSFILSNGDNALKIISIDTNINENGEHKVVTAQMLKQPIRDWIESELLNSTEENIILFSHAGMEDDLYHFNADDAQDFKAMIDDIVLKRPELKVYSIYGHRHQTNVRSDNRLGESVKSYSIPAVVDTKIGKYVEITFYEKDGLTLREHELVYPYP